MKRCLVLCAALLASPLAAQAQTAAPAVQPPAAAELGDLEAAKAALARMQAKLRSLRTFEIISESTDEEVFSNNEKLQFLSRVRYVVDGPNRFYGSVVSDRQSRRYYYDGSSVTVVAPRSGYYATAPLTGTTANILNSLIDDYGIDMPLADLFLWQATDVTMPEITDAFLVGYANLKDRPTNQWFVRVKGADVQLWIGRDDDLPYRMVISNTDDPAQPQYVANLTWNLQPEIKSDRFTFTPTDQNKRIKITQDGQITAAAGGE